jgi:hypothetical protein
VDWERAVELETFCFTRRKWEHLAELLREGMGMGRFKREWWVYVKCWWSTAGTSVTHATRWELAV